MTTATNFTRDSCQLDGRRVSYAKLQREYRCNECGGALVEQWGEACKLYPKSWYISCGACGFHDFIHKAQYDLEKAEAVEVMDGLGDWLGLDCAIGPCMDCAPLMRGKCDN